MEPGSGGPLAGLRVVDWTQFGVGPFATALLGQLGADVIHVEVPPRGDPQQYVPPTINGVAACYINFNTNKRSIQLNLRDADDLDVMWRLLDNADVFVNNLRPGSVARVGLDPGSVMARHPELIYCASTGWGNTGPLAERGCTDPLMQAFCGWCSVTGEEGGPWERLRFHGHIDLNTSLYVTGAVLTALAARPYVGGQVVRISMLEAALAMQATRLTEFLTGGETPRPLGSAASVTAPHQAFECQDGTYIAVGVESDEQWRRLCAAIDRPDLVQRAEYATNARRVARRHALAHELASVFSDKPVAWWTLALSRNQVPCARFWDPELIMVHPQVRANDHLVQIDTGRCGVVYTGGPPWKFEAAPATVTRNPFSGEHDIEVREEVATAKPERPLTPARETPDLPFRGLRVVELATGVSGPYCGALLADHGATVVKVETLRGDRSRAWGPPFRDGVAAVFHELNRNKRSLRLPYDQDEQVLERVLSLVGEADVLLVDFVDANGARPPFDEDRVRAENPSLIMCSISPYGESGPLLTWPGTELTIQAMTNTWAGLGTIRHPPRRLGADQCSMNAGVVAYQGVVAALLRRTATGEGERVAVSQLGTMLAVKGMHFTCLSNPDEWGLHLWLWTDPEDHGIETADRRILLQLPQDPVSITMLLKALDADVPEDMDPYARPLTPPHPSHAGWNDFWSGVLGSKRWADVAKLVIAHGGDVVPYMGYDDLVQDEQVSTLEVFAELDYVDTRTVRVPWRLSKVDDLISYAPMVHASSDNPWQDATRPVAAQTGRRR